MRQKRSKSYKKQMLVYKNTFKFRLPFQVICDENIIEETYNKKYNLLNNLGKILQPGIIHSSSGAKQEEDNETFSPKKTIKLFVTQCSMQHIYETNDEHLIEFVKYNFERRRCNHDYKNPKTSEECIFSITNVTGNKNDNEVVHDINKMVIGTNKHKYIICTQNIDLRRKLRRVPGVPIIHFMNSNVLLLEPISDTTKEYSHKYETQKLQQGLNDAKFAGIKRSLEDEAVLDGSEENEKIVPKKKKGNNPNPLSVKKKTKPASAPEPVKKPVSSDTTEVPKKKRKRVRSKKNGKIENETNEGESKNEEEVSSEVPVEASA